MVALHDLRWNLLFSCQMICKQNIVLNHVFFRYESNLEPVTLNADFIENPGTDTLHLPPPPPPNTHSALSRPDLLTTVEIDTLIDKSEVLDISF